MSKSERVVLVTGATKGIGLGVAMDLAADGTRVLLNYRRDLEQAKRVLEQIRELQPRAELIQADVAVPAEVDRMFRGIRADHGRLDGLVSNAGIANDGYALMMGEQKWRSVLETNLTGSFLVCRAAARLMAVQRGGAIVAVASTSGVNAPAGQANYAASKAGLLAVVRVLAKELGSYGVRVNSVIPGFVDTAMTRSMPQDQLTAFVERVPLGRIGTPADVAPVVRFLLGPESAYVTGASVVIDGGLTC
ncbi:SDR family oxidoreductase [Kribbella solani]|uniref:3-oxoacyl-[acyl-carrier protein] reductase n=1 Tax=Kribbella solani TaxID=236067 RepID=A0A841DFU0_9ACTN|nr:SDR family NAD(P)-dependent oxidoreductase [Kribbella solani]MBB5977382.1 3-oxoacyl-[acyl-carrier protein] reductase [Kribbella solani]